MEVTEASGVSEDAIAVSEVSADVVSDGPADVVAEDPTEVVSADSVEMVSVAGESPAVTVTHLVLFGCTTVTTVEVYRFVTVASALVIISVLVTTLVWVVLESTVLVEVGSATPIVPLLLESSTKAMEEVACWLDPSTLTTS